jgi:putative heme iron utilization protein
MNMRPNAGSGPAPADGLEPSLAERARTLVSLCRAGTLSTHSQKFPGFPFGSMMPYAVDEFGRPVFFVSSMSMHTRNLKQDPRACLLVTDPDISGDPLGAARVSIVGTAVETPAAEVGECYLSRHENARRWQEFSDFAYYRLEVSGVYFIGGFGVMGWVSAEDYGKAAPGL